MKKLEEFIEWFEEKTGITLVHSPLLPYEYLIVENRNFMDNSLESNLFHIPNLNYYKDSETMTIYINDIGSKSFTIPELKDLIKNLYLETGNFLIEYRQDPNRSGKSTRKKWRKKAIEIQGRQQKNILKILKEHIREAESSEQLIAFLDWFVDPEQNNLNFNSSKEYVDVYLKGN